MAHGEAQVRVKAESSTSALILASTSSGARAMDELTLLGILAIVIGVIGLVVLYKGWKRAP